MILPGSYKGTRKRHWARPRTLEAIVADIFKVDWRLLDFRTAREKRNMARTKGQDDPFDDDWGQDITPSGVPDEMPSSTAGERPRFIKPHDVGKAGTRGKLELVRVTSETSEYSDVILAVQFNGKDFRLGLRTFSAEYESLASKFGKKRQDWHGTIRFKVVDNNGKPYVSVRA